MSNPFAFGLRKKTKDRGYDADWKRFRLWILLRDPVCKIRLKCLGAASTEVDHIIPIRFAPHRRLDETNAQGACKPCNAVKAIQDRGKYSFKNEK